MGEHFAGTRITPSVKIKLILICFLGVSISWPPSVYAAIVFNNLGEQDTYDVFAFGFGETLGVSGLYAGAGFNSPKTFTLDALELPIDQHKCVIVPCPDVVEISFTDSSGQGEPKETVESFELKHVLPVHDKAPASQGSLITVRSKRHPLLQAGNRYWVIVTAKNASGGWHQNSVGDFGPVVHGVGGLDQATVFNQNQLAFRVTGTLVPEAPPLSLLLGGGILSLILSGWRSAKLR